MGETPRKRDITVEFDCQFRVNLGRSDFSSIMKAFLILLPHLLEDFFQKVLVGFGEYEMALEKKSFACTCCCNDTDFIWKTRHGKATKVLTWFRWITLKQLQVLCKRYGHKQYITRTLLGIEPRERVPEETRRKLALMGALSSYRVSEKFSKMFGWAIVRSSDNAPSEGKAIRKEFAFQKPQPMAVSIGCGSIHCTDDPRSRLHCTPLKNFKTDYFF